MSRNDVITKIIVPTLLTVASIIFGRFVVPDWETQAMKHGWVDIAQWQAKARQEGWLPQEECPSIPMHIELLSPGDGARIDLDSNQYIRSDILVALSGPISSVSPSIGLLLKPELDLNYYVIFPSFSLYSTQDKKQYKFSNIKIPFEMDGYNNVEVWALVVDDPRSIGEIYTSVSQLKSSSSVFALSDPISWILND